MSLLGLLPQSVTITTVTPGARDGYGRRSQSTATTTVSGRIGQAQTSETTGDRDTVASRFTLYLEPDAVISRADRVTVDGVSYEVDGDPWPVMGASTVHHLEVPLRRVEA